jgi:hypothetical protein
MKSLNFEQMEDISGGKNCAKEQLGGWLSILGLACAFGGPTAGIVVATVGVVYCLADNLYCSYIVSNGGYAVPTNSLEVYE